MKRYILLLFVVCCAGMSQAQQESTLYFMGTVSQSTYSNPAFIPKYATSIGLPGLSSNYFSVFNSGFSFNDVVTRREEDDSLEIDLSVLYANLKRKNYFKTNVESDLFHLAFKINPRLYFNMNATVKARGSIMYPKDIIGLAVEGNAHLMGQEASISPKVNGIAYLESALGFAYKIDPFLTVGTRVKILKGVGNVTTETADFTLTTTDEEITLRGDAMIRTAGVANMEDDIEGFDDVKQLLSNNGFAIDMGATYKPMDKLTVGFSIVDLGGIKWKNNVTNYSVDPSSAQYSFRGVDIEKMIEGDDDFDSELDSISEQFEFQEADGEAYYSALPTKLYLSGGYELTRNLYGNLLLYGEKSPGDFHFSVSANVTKDFGRLMSMGLSYTAQPNAYNNLGAGITFNLAPFQIYFIGDNALGAPLALMTKKEINPYINGLQYFNFRFGINFIGAWQRPQERLSDDNVF